MWEVRSRLDARFPARMLAGLIGSVAVTTGCGGGGSHAPASPTLTPPPVPQQMGSVTVSPQQVALGSAQAKHFAATVAGAGTLVWSVNGIAGGNSSVGTVDSAGDYLAPAVVAPSANVVVQAALASAPQTNFA